MLKYLLALAVAVLTGCTAAPEFTADRYHNES
ncbi:Uncharacterised protein [Raoultella terrigena]|uniref:Lipoprotein n=1 Tax=Raoultella terrigena TaxID=577 RepID=A0A4U9CU02_RAOTE|nr:Uncharacterised protein [Raoultella terrigena]